MHFLFAWRYFKAKKTTNAINIIAWISILAMLIGTAALILVLSVFNGFEGLVKSLYSSFYTDLKVFPAEGKVLTLSQAQLDQIKGVSGVNAWSFVLEEKALVQNGDYQSMVTIKGVDAQYPRVSGVARNVVRGEFTLGNAENPSLVLGSGVENALNVMADRTLLPLVVYLPDKQAGLSTDLMRSVRSQTALASGVFAIQKDFDNKYAITNLDFLRQMTGLREDQSGGLEIALTDPAQANALRDQIQALLGNNFKVMTRYEQNKGLYSVMRAEKWVIYAVLSLILVVAAFNMIGALTMLVLEKRKDTMVLHALGATPGFIQRIFISEGLLLALIGGGLGMILAIVIALGQQHFHWLSLGGGSFLISYFPVELHLADFLLVGATVFLISLLAAWIPARKAGETEGELRY
ncbi:MAG: FtsX-like permease family protein [Chitinophagaceae bacterium]|nr:FtsX-like permease family protein [Chitinophagaceae bacterium]